MPVELDLTSDSQDAVGAALDQPKCTARGDTAAQRLHCSADHFVSNQVAEEQTASSTKTQDRITDILEQNTCCICTEPCALLSCFSQPAMSLSLRILDLRDCM